MIEKLAYWLLTKTTLVCATNFFRYGLLSLLFFVVVVVVVVVVFVFVVFLLVVHQNLADLCSIAAECISAFSVDFWLQTQLLQVRVPTSFVSGRLFSFHVIEVYLLSQSASEKHNQEKKPTSLCAPREFLKQICRPYLVIIKSCYFENRLKPFAYSRCMVCVSCTGHVISAYYVRKGL